MNFSTITPEKIESLKQTLDNMYNFIGKDQLGNEIFDYEKCFKTTQYNIGRLYTELNGLIWKESLILNEMEAQVAKIRKSELEKSKYNVKFQIGNAGELKVWLDGTDDISEQDAQIKKVKSTIIFLQNALNQAAYFATNVKNLMDIKRQQLELNGK